MAENIDVYDALLKELSEEQLIELIRVLHTARSAGFATAEIVYKAGHPFSIKLTIEQLLSGVKAREPGKRSPKTDI